MKQASFSRYLERGFVVFGALQTPPAKNGLHMEKAQAEVFTRTLNRIGVLLYVEVNGTQHRFKLRANELSPARTAYQRSKDHVDDKEYTLVPNTSAESIKNIGKKLFDPGLSLCYDNRNHELTGFDYVITEFGRFFSRESLGKLERICDRLTLEMRRRADELLGKEDYAMYYRDAFMKVYRLFAAEKSETRQHQDIVEGELDRDKLERMYSDLAAFQAVTARRRPSHHLGIGDLDRPDLKTAFKLRNIPRSYDEYKAGLGFSKILTGFHELAFETWAWKEDYWSVSDFTSARTIVFGREPEPQVMLFDDD